MPPKKRPNVRIDAAEPSGRTVTKKRKQEAVEVDEAPQPNRHELKQDDIIDGDNQSTGSTNERTRSKRYNIVVDEPARTDLADEVKSKNKTKTPQTPRKGVDQEKTQVPDSEGDTEKRRPKRRRTKEEKEAGEMPLATRSTGTKKFIGAHVSISGGVENAITNAVHIGGNALALFLQSQRKWENPDLKEENKIAFHKACSHHRFDANSHVVPHGSYLVNLAAKDAEQETKSYKFFLNDLRRCEALGIKYYNFHPGATNKEPLSEAVSKLAKNLNQALSETSTVVPLLENMAGTGTIIGSRFTDLRDIIAQIEPQYQSRIGICIDTCHTFAAGYDLRTPEAYEKTMQELDDVVGLKYLRALHLNDSKGTFNSHKDLHQNIGLGFLGLRAFHNVMNDTRLENIPMILETPSERPDPKNLKKTIDDKKVYADEIKLLESLIGMDPNSDEYKNLEAGLAARGKAERDKMLAWEQERDKKATAKEERARRKIEKAEQGQSKLSGMFKGRTETKKKRKDDSESSSALSDTTD